MQCSKCGAVLDADTVFCPECGAMTVDMTLHRPVMPQLPAEETQEEIPEKLPSEWKIWAKRYRGFLATLGATVGVLLITAIVIIVIALQPGNYTEAIENYIEIAYEGNFEKLDLLVPEAYWNYIEENNTFGLEAYKKEREILFIQQRRLVEFSCGEDVQVSYEVVEEKPVDDAWLDKVKECLEVYGIDSGSVKKAHAIQVTLHFSGSKGTQEDRLTDSYALLIDNCWYLAKGDYSYIGGVSFYMPFRGGLLIY